MFSMLAQNKVPIESAEGGVGGGGGQELTDGGLLKASIPWCDGPCDLLSTNVIRDVRGYNQPRA